MSRAAVIASKGRPGVLGETLRSLAAQTAPPEETVLVVPGPEHLPEGAARFPGARVVLREGGVTEKLNAGVDACSPGVDRLALLDDDVELAADYFERADRLFRERPDVVMFDGEPLHAGPCDRETARRVVSAPAPDPAPPFRPGVPVWGCNMNVRRAVFARERFDERIASYGWLREYDFGDRVARLGVTGRHPACRVAHLAAPGGRISDVQYGYAQLMNPVYYLKKGTVVRSLPDLFFGHFCKALAANFAGWARGDRSCRRLERLRGNLLALAAAARGRSDPEGVRDVR